MCNPTIIDNVNVECSATHMNAIANDIKTNLLPSGGSSRWVQTESESTSYLQRIITSLYRITYSNDSG